MSRISHARVPSSHLAHHHAPPFRSSWVTPAYRPSAGMRDMRKERKMGGGRLDRPVAPTAPSRTPSLQCGADALRTPLPPVCCAGGHNRRRAANASSEKANPARNLPTAALLSATLLLRSRSGRVGSAWSSAPSPPETPPLQAWQRHPTPIAPPARPRLLSCSHATPTRLSYPRPLSPIVPLPPLSY